MDISRALSVFTGDGSRSTFMYGMVWTLGSTRTRGVRSLGGDAVCACWELEGWRSR